MIEDALDNSDASAENAGVAAAGRQRGTHMGFARMLATIFFVIALPVALVTTNIRLLANAPFVYDWAYDRYDAERTTGLSREDLDGAGGALRDYFNNDEKTFYYPVTKDGLPGPIFNARETRHMEDVKSLFVTLNRVQEITVIYVLAYVVGFFIWSRDGSVRQLASHALLGLGVGGVVIAAVGVVAAFGFDAAWDRMHGIVFTNDFWRLNPNTDRLIQMFPEPFWRDMTILLGAMCAAEAALIGVVAVVYLMGTRHERARLAGQVDVNTSATQAA